MAGSVNKVILVGNLGADPKIDTLPNGSKVARLTLATSEYWNDKASGERRERTEWHRVVIFNDRLVGVAERFLKKGRKVLIEGQLQTRKWQDQSGQDRYTTEIVLTQFRGEIVLVDSNPDNQNTSSGGLSNPHDPNGYGARSMSDLPAAPASSSTESDPFSDEIPF